MQGLKLVAKENGIYAQSTKNKGSQSKNRKAPSKKPVLMKPKHQAIPSFIKRTNRALVNHTKIKPQQDLPRAQTGIPQKLFTRCAAKYFRALYDPFHPDATGACIPSMIALPSMKFTTTIRMGFTAGLNGYGGAVFRPMRMFSVDTQQIGNNRAPAVICTNGNYAGDDTEPYAQLLDVATFDTTQSPPQFIQTVACNSPYSLAYLGNATSRTLRLVGAGMRVMQTGKLMDVQGEYITWHNQDPTSRVPPAQDGVSDLLSVRSTCWDPVSANNYAELTYRPILESDLEYVREPGDVPVNNPTAFTTAVWGRLAGGILLRGATPGTRYTVEAVAHFEMQGPQVAYTSNSSAPDAVGPIIAAAPTTTTTVPTQSMSTRQRVQEYVSNFLEMAHKDGYSWRGTAVEAANLLQGMRAARGHARLERHDL